MEKEVVQYLILAAFGGVAWFMKRTLDRLDDKTNELDKELTKVKAEYLHKDEFKDFKTELRSWFEEIKIDIRALRHPNV